jgi:hypothetical protein
MPEDKRVLIFRRPCFTEDEGHSEYIKTCPTKQVAVDWIEAQENEFFRPLDYYIIEEKQ